jgi:DNA-binding MarR family transcriptional regulator
MKEQNLLLLENQLCFPIYATSRMIIRLYQPFLEKINLTYPQYLVMMVLWEKDAVTVNEIGQRLYLNSNTLTPILKKLGSKGFVNKKRSTQDERKVIVKLTKKGTELEEKAKMVPVSLLENINISNEDLLKMREIMWKFLEELVGSDDENESGCRIF